MIRQVLCVTGLSAVGKSTIVAHISREVSVPSFGLGTYERAKFASLGDPEDFERKCGLDATYYGIMPEQISEISRLASDKGIIVEGVYTMGFVCELAKLFRADVHILGITAPYADRVRNWQKRTGMEREEAEERLNRLDAIKHEVGIAEVLGAADVVVDNHEDLDNALSRARRIAKGIFGW